MKTFFAFGIYLVLLSESLSQTISNPSDFFPLNTGRNWTYSYHSLEKVYADIAFQVSETVDSGLIKYVVGSMVVSDTARIWNIQEQDSIYSYIHNYQSGTDSSFTIKNNISFQCIEMFDSLHALLSSSDYPPLTFPIQWGLRNGSPIFRYGKDSSYQLLTEYQYIGGTTWNYFDTLLFQRDVGLINAKSITSKGPNTPYYFEWEAKLTSTLTSVTHIAKANPFSFYLQQNYPNPFNPSTTISFILSTKCYVSLEIYDLLVRRIDKLINQTLEPGKTLFDP